MSERMLGMGFGILAAVTFSASNFLVRHASGRFPASQILFFRFLLAMILLTPLVYREIPLLWKKGCAPLWIRFCGGALALLILYENVRLTGLAGASALNHLSAVFVVLGGALMFQDRLSLKEWLGIFVVLLGATILQSPWGISIPALGLLLGLTGAFSLATSLLALKKSASQASSLFMVWGFCFFCGMIGLAKWHPLPSFSVPFDWAWLFCLGSVGILGQMFMTRAYALLPAGIASAVCLSEIVWSIILESIYMTRVPPVMAIASYAMMLSGLLLLIKRESLRRAPVLREVEHQHVEEIKNWP
jgi:drug/metabolite transporter (DMT)-like permease